MAARKRKSKQINLSARYLFGIFLAFVCGFLAYDYLVGRNVFFSQRDLADRAKTLKQEISEIEEENASLMEEIENMNQSFFVEKIAREELGMGKDGEVVFYIMEEEPEKTE